MRGRSTLGIAARSERCEAIVKLRPRWLIASTEFVEVFADEAVEVRFDALAQTMMCCVKRKTPALSGREFGQM
jgi:hypothetical protein